MYKCCLCVCVCVMGGVTVYVYKNERETKKDGVCVCVCLCVCVRQTEMSPWPCSNVCDNYQVPLSLGGTGSNINAHKLSQMLSLSLSLSECLWSGPGLAGAA